MSRSTLYLTMCIVVLAVLTSAGPAVIGVLYAAVPIVIAVGSVAIVGRIVWYFTGRY